MLLMEQQQPKQQKNPGQDDQRTAQHQPEEPWRDRVFLFDIVDAATAFYARAPLSICEYTGWRAGKPGALDSGILSVTRSPSALL